MPDPTPPKATPPRATDSQLRYLRTRAALTGQTFAYPATTAEASHEINRLRRVPRTPRADVARERRQVADDMANRRGDAARVRPDELEGHGSSARWAGRGDDQ